MKRTFLFLFFGIGFLLSCSKGSGNEEKLVDDIMEDSSNVTDQIRDPDTTDNVAGDQYLIYAISEKTADVVRNRLTQLYADDLKIGIVDSLSRKFIFFEFDLNEDGSKEILVGLTGPYFCGSGGCTQFILNAEGEVISRFTVSDYPVTISTDKSNGWRDLFILSGGAYRVVKFDGKTYPSNPSLLPKSEFLPGDGLPRALDFMNDKYPWFRF